MTRRPSTYRASLLAGALATSDGIVFHEDGERRLLPWSRVLRALAAEVGEPEGVRTVVFDLVSEMEDDACVAFRFDVDPVDALHVARAIEEGIGKECGVLSLHVLAAEGRASHSFVDVDAFEAAALAALRTR